MNSFAGKVCASGDPFLLGAVKSCGDHLLLIAHSPLCIAHFRHILTQQTNHSTRQATTYRISSGSGAAFNGQWATHNRQ